MTTIPAITLWQPWASWILLGWKGIETRTHARLASLAGKWVAIHAGQRWHQDAYEIASLYLSPGKIAYSLKHLHRRHGQVLCVAHVIEHRRLLMADSRRALCPAYGLHGLVFDRIIRLPRGMLAQGHQGIWNWTPPDHVLQQIRRSA